MNNSIANDKAAARRTDADAVEQVIDVCPMETVLARGAGDVP